MHAWGCPLRVIVGSPKGVQLQNLGCPAVLKSCVQKNSVFLVAQRQKLVACGPYIALLKHTQKDTVKSQDYIDVWQIL